MLKITKKGTSNFVHFNGFVEMNFSTWQINFNDTLQNVILVQENGASFPKVAETIANVIVVDETDTSIEETFATTQLLRARLIEIGYNALVSSEGGGGGSVTSVNGQTGDVVLNANDVGAIPLPGTEEGNPVTGEIISTSNFKIASLQVGVDESYTNIETCSGFIEDDNGQMLISHSAAVVLVGGTAGGIAVNNDLIKTVIIYGTSPLSEGLVGDQDFTPNLSDLAYPQKIYVDTKLADSTTPATPVLADKMIIKDVSDSNNSKEITLTDLKSVVDNGAIKDEQIEISANTNVLDAWNGKTILVTASCTITVPATLMNQLMFVGRTLAGVTITWAITSPFTWETTPTTTTEKKTFSFMRRGSTNTILFDS